MNTSLKVAAFSAGITLVVAPFVTAILKPHLEKVSRWSESLSWANFVRKGHLTRLLVTVNVLSFAQNAYIVYAFLTAKGAPSRFDIVLVVVGVLMCFASAGGAVYLVAERPFERAARLNDRVKVLTDKALSLLSEEDKQRLKR